MTEDIVIGIDNGRPRKKRLLVVDDNKDFTEMAQHIFGAEFDVLSEDEGQPGLRKCLEWQPDVVLLDVNMPSMNGIEFLRLMSQDPALATIPVVVITASDFNGITESLARRYTNMSAFITKLSPPEVVREKILKAMVK
ncbi:MAG: response regulator [Elusimicrobiota bacterium]|nr:response regulator [Elusimicrobiota bacterium]